MRISVLKFWPVLVGIAAELFLAATSIAQTSKPSTQPAAKANDFPFLAVFIDDATEKELGPFPYDREVIARSIRELDKAGARAIVIMFYFDLPKSSKGDAELAKAIANSKAKVILQAAVQQGENNPNPLPPRFNWDHAVPAGVSLIGGDNGWIPLPIFVDHAYDVGFTDIRIAEEAPLLEMSEHKPVKSLFTCALEAGLNDPAEITPGDSL
jgi:hypothetical protein